MSSDDKATESVYEAAYGSPFRVVAILIAGVSLFNLAHAIISLSPVAFLQALLAAYRYIFHSIVEIMLYWWPFPLPAAAKDILVLWVLVATTLLRWLRIAGLHQDFHRGGNRFFAVVYYIYFYVVTLALGPILLVVYFWPGEPLGRFLRLYFRRPTPVVFPPIKLLYGITEKPFEKVRYAKVLLLMFAGSVAACSVLIAFNAFFGHPGTLPSG